VKPARWPAGLVAVSGMVLALAFKAWDSRHSHTALLGGDLVALLLTLALASLLLWRISSAALAAWSGLEAAVADRLDALTHLPLLLVAASLAPRGRGFAAAGGLLFVLAKAAAFWTRRPPGVAPAALVLDGQRALRAGAAAARHPLALVVLALLLIDVRLLYLSADPPVDLGPSGGAWTDPAAYAHNARNRILLGQWVWDEVNFMYVSPLSNLSFYVVFRLLGIGYPQMGLVSVLFSLATLPLFYFGLKGSFGRGGALLATLLLGANHLFITYNRVGLVETPAIFFQVLTLYFGQRGTADSRFFALAGAASLMALPVKMQTAYIFPAALLSVLVWTLLGAADPRERRRWWPPLAWFLGGAAIGLGVLAAVWIIPYRDEITWRLNNEWRLHSLPTTVPGLLSNVYYNPFFGYFFSFGSWVLLLLGVPFLFRLLANLLRGAPVPFARIFAFWWFVGGFSYLAISQYRPLRYYVALVPPMVIFAAAALVGLWRSRPAPRPPGPSAVWAYGAGIFVLTLTAIQVGHARLAAIQRKVVPLPLYPITERQFLIGAGVLALLASLLVVRLLGPRLPRLARGIPVWVPRALVVVLVGAFFLTEGRAHLQWVWQREYQLVTISRRLGTTLPEGSVVAGIYSPVLTMENRHRSLAIWDRYGNWTGDPLARFGITHVVVMDYIDEAGYYRRRFPEAMARARLLEEWTLWKTRVSLYALPPRG
jgi:hypothetical protein